MELQSVRTYNFDEVFSFLKSNIEKLERADLDNIAFKCAELSVKKIKDSIDCDLYAGIEQFISKRAAFPFINDIYVALCNIKSNLFFDFAAAKNAYRMTGSALHRVAVNGLIELELTIDAIMSVIFLSDKSIAAHAKAISSAACLGFQREVFDMLNKLISTNGDSK